MECNGPALQSISAEGRTTGEIVEAGNIRIAMFQQLLAADLVGADIRINTPAAGGKRFRVLIRTGQQA